jgi:hypothetical protein
MTKGWDWGLGRYPLKDTVAVELGGISQRVGGCGKWVCRGDEARTGRYDEGLGLGVRPLTTEGHGGSRAGRRETEVRWAWEVYVSRGRGSMGRYDEGLDAETGGRRLELGDEILW